MKTLGNASCSHAFAVSRFYLVSARQSYTPMMYCNGVTTEAGIVTGTLPGSLTLCNDDKMYYY